MAKKRKAPKSFDEDLPLKSAKFDIEERFDDSEDEFYTGRDKILLEEEPDVRRRKRLAAQEQHLQLSDEEIGGYESELAEDSDDDVESSKDDISDAGPPAKRLSRDDEEDDELSDEGNWGTNRADYYGDDIIETEEQAIEEENEAKRLHQKQLKGMTAADFGFDENEWAVPETTNKSQRSVTEKLPEARIPENATKEQKLEILRARYPEFEPLAEEYASLQELKRELDVHEEIISAALKKGANMGPGLPVKIKQSALAAYMGTIAMYFAIVSMNVTAGSATGQITAISPLELHDHLVISNLARARQLWEQVADEPVADAEEPEPHAKDETSDLPTLKPGKVVQKIASAKPDMNASPPESQRLQEKRSKPKTINGHSITATEKKSRGKKKHKALDVADLMETSVTNDIESESDYGDEKPLTEEQYAEKARKRKSLRFYTSQITSKANKRGHASREAGGDDDVPYKERNRDRQQRLMKEAEARGRQQPDMDQFDDADGYDEMPMHDRNDEYYDTLLNVKDKKRADKQAKAEAYARAAAEGATVYEEETVGPDGKRAITYAISKNKGLMPKRKKDVRNPRVKKRKKFDEKMKKLGSMRQIYKGGEGRGGYGGELTGIKTNLVKSVKL